MNCTMHRRVITAGRARRRGVSRGQRDAAGRWGHHSTQRPGCPWGGAAARGGCVGVPTVEWVGDEGRGGASNHLSGGLEEKRAVSEGRKGRRELPSPAPSSSCAPHLLEDLLQRGHMLLLAGSWLETGRGIRRGTAPQNSPHPPQAKLRSPPAPAPPARTAPCFSSQASLGRHQEPAQCWAAAANPHARRARPCLAAAAAGDRRGGGGGGGEGRIHHQSLLQRTSACSASWYRCREKGTRSGGTTGSHSPSGPGARGTVPAALCCAPRCQWRWSRAGG